MIIAAGDHCVILAPDKRIDDAQSLLAMKLFAHGPADCLNDIIATLQGSVAMTA